ncbi:Down syndrome cell adhesion molecule-like protein [Penaeus vannamei]|uniref:Down syndrome cell adhesion molecule-like protein n=1 Tax=Penaeus vannamei TaxID=6689 RepID=A0A3R7Q9D2_PENVA|nr:Down syndrome cell adhesion molecule-like protein [Penaeus vannamei]
MFPPHTSTGNGRVMISHTWQSPSLATPLPQTYNDLACFPFYQVMGLREVLTNGSLVFPPFPANQYDTQLHANTYICRATSAGGTVLARPSQIRAVVVGDYEVQVYDQLVMAGNTAVLRCAVPSYVREYVTVTSWVHDDSFNIYPSLHGDGKYHMTPEGDLHVLEVGPQDGLSRYQCRTLHTLTGRAQLSHTPARIIVTVLQCPFPPISPYFYTSNSPFLSPIFFFPFPSPNFPLPLTFPHLPLPLSCPNFSPISLFPFLPTPLFPFLSLPHLPPSFPSSHSLP